MGRRSAISLVVVLLVLVVTASAHAYTRPCTATGVWDPDVCERAEETANYAQILGVGVWFLFGGVLALIAAPMMNAAFRWWRA